MPKIPLPDGSAREYDAVTRGAEIAESIGKGLAKAAVAVRVDGELWQAEGPEVIVESVPRALKVVVTS